MEQNIDSDRDDSHTIEHLMSMVTTLAQTCRTLEERVRILEQSRAPTQPRARKRPSQPRRMIMTTTGHRNPMVHLAPCTVTFHRWITCNGFQPYIDLNYYFEHGFWAGIYHTIQSRIIREKETNKNELPLCTVPISNSRIVWMVYDSVTTLPQENTNIHATHCWKEATQDILHQIYYYVVFETEKVFNVWDMEHGEEMMTHQPDKYASYVVSISGRHQGEQKAKQELGRKLIEWCRP